MSGELFERLPCHAVDRPSADRGGAYAPVESYRRLVPVKDRPLHPPATALPRESGEVSKEGAADPGAPELGPDVEVFELDAWPPEER